MDETIVEARLRKDEGYEVIPYLDTLQNWTGGIGHKMTAAVASQYMQGIPDQLIQAWFDTDFKAALAGARAYVWFPELNVPRQQIIVCLEFNMGPSKFAGFHQTQASIAAGDFVTAPENLLDSLWAKQVHCDTPESRGQTYARILRTGIWE